MELHRSNYARYVGRVGALAVALGIGTAVITTPGRAWADEPGASSNEGPSQNASGTGTTSDAGGQNTTAAGNSASSPDTEDHQSSSTTGLGTATTTTTTSTQGSTTTTVGGGSSPQVTFDHSSNTGSIGTGVDDPAPVAPDTATVGQPIVESSSPSTAEVTIAASTPPPTLVTPTVPITPTVNENLADVATSTPSAPGTAAAANLLALAAAPSANTIGAAGVPTGQDTPPTFAARFAVPHVANSVMTNSPQAIAFSAPAAPTTPVPTVPPPTLTETVFALPGTIVSTALNLITQALAPVFGPGAPADNPVLWGVLAFVRRQFNQGFANSTPELAPRQTSQDLDDGQVHGTFGGTDADGDTLTYAVPTTGEGAPVNGDVTIDQAAGTWTYTPDAGYVGQDSFIVTASDDTASPHIHTLGQTHLATARVEVTVAPVVTVPNSAPVVTAPPTAGSPNGLGVIKGALNVTDDDVLHYGLVTGPSSGSVSFDPASGTYTYTPTTAARRAATLTPNTIETDGFVVDVSDATHDPVRVTVSNLLVTELAANTAVAVVEVGNSPGAIIGSPDGSRSYVVNTADDTVTVLNGFDNSTTQYMVGDRPVALAVNSDGTRVYVANAGDKTVSAIDTQTGAVVVLATIDGEPTGIATDPNGAVVYTTNTNSTISVIDLATRNVTTLPIDPFGLVTNNDGSRLYAVNQADGVVSIIARQGDGYAVVDTVTVGHMPSAIALSPDQEHLYVTNTGDDTVSVITLADGSAVLVNVGDQPRGIAVAPDGRRLYVANFGSDTVSIIDTATNTVITSVPVGDGPYGIALNAAGTLATVTNSLAGSATVLILVGNQTPTVNPTVTSPDPVTGVVRGAINPTDPNGDPLTFTVTTNATHGDVSLNPDGSFTYTPSASARQQATVTAGDDVDGFSITVDDGHGAQIAVPVTVQIAPIGALATATIDGLPGDGVILSADGSRAIEVTYAAAGASTSPTVTVIDTRTGAKVGDTFVFGAPVSNASVSFAPTGPYASIVTQSYDAATNSGTSYLTIIDTATGTQVGQTVALAGYSYGRPQFDPQGDRAFLVTLTSPNNVSSTHIAVIDAATGVQIGSTIDEDGEISGLLVFGPDGSRAYQATSQSLSSGDPVHPYLSTTRVVTIDVGTGLKIGDTLDLTGFSGRGLQFVPGSSRAFQTTMTYDTINGYQTRVVVVDTADMTVVGDPIVTSGTPGSSYGLDLSPDGGHAVLVTGVNNANSVAVIDTGTGTVVGTAAAVSGTLRGVVFTPDGAHAIVTSSINSFFSNQFSANVLVIDLATAAPVGNVQVQGTLGEVRLSADGTRAVIVSTPPSTPGGSNVEVRVLDTATGALVAPPATIGGYYTSGLLVTTDGRAILTGYDISGSTITSKLAVINLADGSFGGETTLGTGYPQYGLRLAGDGSRAYLTVSLNDEATQTPTTRVLVVDIHADPLLVGSLTFGGAEGSGGVALTPDGTRALVATRNGGPELADFTTRVTTIDTAAFAFIGGYPSAAAAVGPPDAGTGQVAVMVNASDPDGDALTYTVTHGPRFGSVSDGGAGGFAYTPTDDARAAAAATPAADFDTFVVTVDDGRGGRTNTAITVEVAPAAVVV